VLIREELPADHAAIHHLTKIAFEPKKFSDGTEPDIIDKLRADGDLALSLVAEKNTDIVGHVAFSAVVIGPDATGKFTHDWYGLGPIAVNPELQGTGIGSSLVQHGLQILREKDARGCALIGDPKYYSRFGFVSDGNVQYGDLPSEHVQWLSFGESQPAGELVFCPAFGD